jgi:hypothetical protein
MQQVRWQDIETQYEDYESFDGTPIRNRSKLGRRLLVEEDTAKRFVLNMFLNVSRRDNVFLGEYASVEQVNKRFPSLLKCRSEHCCIWTTFCK